MYDSFEHAGHLCLVFEPMGSNLREVVKKVGGGLGINIDAVRSFSRQLFTALNHLLKCEILHADIKPDNILVSSNQKIVKICDFGSAGYTRGDCEITPYLVSRFYRAPEIILGSAYDGKADVFSIGCVLFEMYTGKILFSGKDNNEMLRMMQEYRGGFPKKLLRTAQFRASHFDEEFKFLQRGIDPLTGMEITKAVAFTNATKDLMTRLVAGRRNISDHERTKLKQLCDLISQCISLSPHKRISVRDALKHPFLIED
jgi:serine/threonine-protein kinase PRP4